jgi:hypothetical protein
VTKYFKTKNKIRNIYEDQKLINPKIKKLVMDTMQILTPLNILEPKLKKLNLSQSSNK